MSDLLWTASDFLFYLKGGGGNLAVRNLFTRT